MDRGQITYYLFRIAGAILPFFSRRLGLALSVSLGNIIYYTSARPRSIVLANLQRVLDPEVSETRRKAIARQVFQNSVKNYFELFHDHRLSEERLRLSIEVEGEEHVRAALARGKGLIVATMHLGSIDAFLHIAPLFGYHITGSAEIIRPKALLNYLLRLRQRRGVTLLPTEGALFALVRALKNNEVVGIAVDRDAAGSGMMIDFFGGQARLAHGAVHLALRTGATLCLGYGLRNADNTFLGIVEPPLELEVSGDIKRDLRLNMEKVVQSMERVIRAHPHQWLMFQPLWESDGQG